jgi:hypothetical protein
VSSILEALRELEGERPVATRREIPPSERPRAGAPRAIGAFIPVLGGLAVGVLAVAAYLWSPVTVTSQPEPASPAPPAEVAKPDASEPSKLAWLETADAPRAKVSRGPSAAPPAEPATAPADDLPASERAGVKPAPAASGQVAVESIRYAANAMERVATMRIGGRRVTLRQRESVDGVEVQLIMPNGVYLQRGSEVYLIPYTR